MITSNVFTFSSSDLHLRLPSAAPEAPTSSFDRAFQSRWLEHMSAGHFRYPFGEAEYRLHEGSKYGFVLQHIPDRASNRRTPQAMMSLSEPFDPNKFNFTKINEEKEVVFEIRQTDGSNGDGTKPAIRDLLVINVSPFELGASLLLPRMEECSSQTLSAHSFSLGIRTLLLSGTPQLKLAFNSLCAYASVNHRHWHVYYLRSTKSLLLERARLEPLVPGGLLYRLAEGEYPAKAFVLQLSTLDEIDAVAERAFKITNYLTETNTAHNAFVTRGMSSPNLTSYDCIRVFIFAREPIVGTKDPGANTMAACELAGHILCYQEESFKTMTEEHLAGMQKKATERVYAHVEKDVVGLFS